MKKISKDEYNKIYGAGSSGTIHSDNKIHTVYKQAMEAIRYLQSINSNMLYGGNIKIKSKIFTNKGDGSNIFKGIEDALQGIVFKDDKQVTYGSFILYRNRGDGKLE